MHETGPSLTISLVLYQTAREQIADLLASIAALQRQLAAKLLVVDNGGCAWAAQLPGVESRYLAAPRNLGYGKGHNLALQCDEVRQAQWHLIVNPDIAFDAEGIVALLAAATQRPEGLFMPKIVYPDGQRQEACRLLPTPLNLFARRFLPFLGEHLDHAYLLRDADFNQAFFVPALSGCFMLFRSQALLALGGFDPRYFMYMEDVDLSRRAASQFGACYLPAADVRHAHAQASYKNSRMLRMHMVSAIRYFNKWGWIFDAQRKNLNHQCLARLPRLS